jgi:hypothetical protein
VVTGGGGGSLYPQYGRHPASAQFHYRWHCVQVTVEENRLYLQAVDQAGAVFDEEFIQRALPAPQLHQAAWHTPVAAFTDGYEADGDGNRPGQQFDFAGTPIPTLPGTFSNLGRCWVNQDHRHLYLGFEQVMIPEDGNVFVFLDSPALPGVATLAGIGNGVVDPEGEGVDGLDFLGNLDFQGFRPALSCLLGDEFADGTVRGFLRTNIVAGGLGTLVIRTNLALPVGQGVFRLEPGLPDVPGARVEQFNRSPQVLPVAGEQNADFMAVALPLSSLGLRGGEVIRLAAVVGGGAYSTNVEFQARELDTGFLGEGASGSGLGRMLLTGVAVQLSPDLDPDGDGLTVAEELALGTLPEHADSDGDGLPDGWEHHHGLDPLSPESRDGAAGDPDQDGATNADEYGAGTEPANAASVLRVNAARSGGAGIEIVWSSVPGRRYGIEGSPTAQGGYVPVEGAGLPREATGRTERLRLPLTEALQFYRLRVVP